MTQPQPRTISLALMGLLLAVDTVVFLLEKVASNRSHGTGMEFYTHLLAQPFLYVSLALGVVQMWTWTRTLATTDLSLAYPITSLSYPATMLAAYLLLGERLPWQVWTGGALITTGVLYMGSSPTPAPTPVSTTNEVSV